MLSHCPIITYGQTVRVKSKPQLKHDSWIPATVLDKVAPRSYDVEIPNKGIARRNRTHIRETLERRIVDGQLPEVSSNEVDVQKAPQDNVELATQNYPVTPDAPATEAKFSVPRPRRSGRAVKTPTKYIQ